MSLQAFGGSIALSGLANYQNPKHPTFDLNLNIQSVKAKQLLGYSQSLNRFGHLADYVSGNMGVQANFKGALDDKMSLDLNSLNSAGSLQLVGANLSGHPIQKESWQALQKNLLLWKRL